MSANQTGTLTVSNLREVCGVMYCVEHGGLDIEGTDEGCDYEENESDADCVLVALYHEAGPA